MKKLMVAFAAIAAFVSVASAEDAWFTGTIGNEAAGKWTMTPGSGTISTNNTTLVLDEADSALFKATDKKTLSSSTNLNFATRANFKYSYDTLPEVDSQAKAGVVVYQNTYYVLAKDVGSDPASNVWVSTEISATLTDAVDVSVTITNGTDGAHALYTIGGSTLDKLVVAGDSAWGTVDYKGSGEVASLVGTTTSLSSGWITPGGYAIEVDPAWAAANGINAEAFADATKLSNGFSASESYILGLNTNEAFVATLGKNAEGHVFQLKQPAVKVADKVSFNVYIDGNLAAESVSFPYGCFDRSNVGTTERTIQLRPNVSGQGTTGTSQTIGVWATQTIASNQVDYVTIPYECAVSNCLWNVNNEQHWDFMDVYDAASGNWDRWQVYNNSTKWEYVPTADRTTPITTVLKPGQAVKITVGDCKATFGNKKVFYRVGTKVDRDKTAVVPNAYNLVGNPNDAATPLAKFDATDKVRAFDPIEADANYHALPDVSYMKYGANWYKISLNGTGTVVTEIGSNVHGFFLYTSGTEVDWTPAAK